MWGWYVGKEDTVYGSIVDFTRSGRPQKGWRDTMSELYRASGISVEDL